MNWVALIAALIAVESGGDAAAVGDGGDAWGPLQIHAAVLVDVNRHWRTAYGRDDCFNPDSARRICKLYLMQWCGAVATPEQYARTWNGGPHGVMRAATESYWERVRPHYERLAEEQA